MEMTYGAAVAGARVALAGAAVAGAGRHVDWFGLVVVFEPDEVDACLD